MKAWDFMESGELTAESRQLIIYFMKNTTEKIFRRMNLQGISAPSIRNSIYAVVYNNAGGNDALVRFYYINLARFIELGVGKYAGDADLGREGVKAINVNIPSIKSGSYGPLNPTFHGSTDAGIPVTSVGRDKKGNPVPRDKHHKAKPFFMNTIRLEMRRIAERLATQMAYTHTAYLVRGLSGIMALDEVDKAWRDTYKYVEVMRRQMGAMPVDIENAFSEFFNELE